MGVEGEGGRGREGEGEGGGVCVSMRVSLCVGRVGGWEGGRLRGGRGGLTHLHCSAAKKPASTASATPPGIASNIPRMLLGGTPVGGTQGR